MPGKDWTQWSAAEDDLIREHAGLKTCKGIAALMPPRSESGVQQRASILRVSMRMGVRRPGEPPLPAIRKKKPVRGRAIDAAPADDEQLSEDGARRLIGLAQARGKTPRALITALMEIVVREPTLIDNILDEG